MHFKMDKRSYTEVTYGSSIIRESANGTNWIKAVEYNNKTIDFGPRKAGTLIVLDLRQDKNYF